MPICSEKIWTSCSARSTGSSTVAKPGDGHGVVLPARPLTAADMQCAKAIYMQCMSLHPMWCTCKPGEQQHKYPKKPIDTIDVEKAYRELVAYCEETVGCEFKEFDEMCCAAHDYPA
eukprot:1342024-Pleurochrysis_carterae.AAC.1